MQGDWHPDATLKPGIINITVDDTGKIDHVGIGYAVVLPSGQVATNKGWTWHSPPAEITAPAPTIRSLQNVVDKLLAAATEAEGLSS